MQGTRPLETAVDRRLHRFPSCSYIDSNSKRKVGIDWRREVHDGILVLLMMVFCGGTVFVYQQYLNTCDVMGAEIEDYILATRSSDTLLDLGSGTPSRF
jgi:hypothetical protein